MMKQIHDTNMRFPKYNFFVLSIINDLSLGSFFASHPKCYFRYLSFIRLVLLYDFFCRILAATFGAFRLSSCSISHIYFYCTINVQVSHIFVFVSFRSISILFISLKFCDFPFSWWLCFFLSFVFHLLSLMEFNWIHWSDALFWAPSHFVFWFAKISNNIIDGVAKSRIPFIEGFDQQCIVTKSKRLPNKCE